MGRVVRITVPQPVRKPVSFAIEPAFPDVPAPGVVAPAPVTPRVRDNLVLRVVAKKKVGERSPSDERRAR